MSLSSNDIDASVDEKIYEYLNLDNPKSFFLFAGAGSGKTRSLVKVLSRIRDEQGDRLYLNAQKIAVITYTNAACNEIKHRLGNDTIFSVSTIHSFAWELIKPFQQDIRGWLETNLEKEILELEEAQKKGRSGTKASIDRPKKIKSKADRKDMLEEIKQFTYNPNSDNRSRDSLNHSEVIQITADFLKNKTLMQKILVKKFPILLIDESQDTNKLLINAFFQVQKNHFDKFSLALFGDTMQRIYSDGEESLGKNIPDTWERPEKKINHRCPKRVVKLINKIRQEVDFQEQIPRDNADEGIVRFFIVDSSTIDKQEIENQITIQMAQVTEDEDWSKQNKDIKVLTLEHHMAAKRMGFLDLYQPLYQVEKFRTGLLDGTLQGIRLFTDILLPLIEAMQNDDKFLVSTIVKRFSPLLDKNTLKQEKNQIEKIKDVNKKVNKLLSLWKNENDPKLIEVLLMVTKLKLFKIPEILIPIAKRTKEEQNAIDKPIDEEDKDAEIDAWDIALEATFSQIGKYYEYISDNAPFGTHQGVKGLEFPRVMVILDDDEARGFLFSYEKLFGAKDATSTDIKNQKEGKETSIDRTRRLFYVGCSRAEKSLAIVAYTKEPAKVKSYVLSQGWFDEEEII